ncbi:antirestriction protein ArdA [Dysgonomonas sp. UBA7698]|uniref:antirestriction protein ArdA n=1 Tax=Dysgonomonas sp. UBA7698 TaxID=1946427 RepID=UPI0025B8DCAA|nr:antirestriction protein ArdA [Dysgonomonas sp. UBA7698]
MDNYVLSNSRVYVSTRKRYTAHDHFGIWVELSGFEKRKDYAEHCRKLFPDEHEPAIIHLDWQNIPPYLINESGISSKVFKLTQQVIVMEEIQQQGFAIWLARQPDTIYTLKSTEIIQSFIRSYMGYFGDTQQFATYHAKETMGIIRESNPHFDFISYANRLFEDKFIMEKGFVFLPDKK